MNALANITTSHNKGMAREFLTALDPNATRFTFQFISDAGGGRSEIFHGSLDELWPKVEASNNLQHQYGVFVTPNETDFKGRKEKNIVRARALFVDADGPEQVEHCESALAASAVAASAIVRTGRGAHYYFFADVPRYAFSDFQQVLIDKLGTDRSIKDLPRVMRLPGTLHVKDPSRPRLVTLEPPAGPRPRYSPDALVAALGASSLPRLSSPSPASPASDLTDFSRIDAAVQQLFKNATERLSDGLEADVDEIRSAALAIPPSVLATEHDWVRIARGIAREAAIYSVSQEKLYAILDEVSRRAPGYDEEDNRRRFDRYINEAFDCEKPLTIATLFDLARTHGWSGYASVVPSTSIMQNPTATATSRAVPIASLPVVPPKRKWLHGTDLIRGAVTVLAAPGGKAKSTWLLACALACASGRDLLGSHIFGGPLRVLCLSTEDGISEMTLRIRAAMKHYGLSDADVSGLFVIGADAWGLPLLQANGNRPLLDERGVHALTVELDTLAPDVLIIDPVINLLGGVSVNDNAAAALLMGHLARLAATRSIAIALAHHASKGRDPTSAESAMGAASYINLARVALAIEPLDEKDAGTIGVPPWEAKSIFRLIGTKQNFAPPSTQDRWFQVGSVDMHNPDPPIYLNGDAVAVVAPFQPGKSTAAFPPGLVKDALLAVDGANPQLSPSKRSTERYAAPVIADAIAGHRGGRASELEGKAVLDHLLKTGLLEVAEVKITRAGKGSDLRKGLVLTTAGKLAAQQAGQIIPASSTPQSPQSPATPSAGNVVDAGGDQSCGSPATQGGYGGKCGGDDAGLYPVSHAVPTSAPEVKTQRRSGPQSANATLPRLENDIVGPQPANAIRSHPGLQPVIANSVPQQPVGGITLSAGEPDELY
jgi:hypothetical protein